MHNAGTNYSISSDNSKAVKPDELIPATLKDLQDGDKVNNRSVHDAECLSLQGTFSYGVWRRGGRFRLPERE